jgi:hypothetical protein
MAGLSNSGYVAAPITATALVKTGPGVLGAIVVGSSTAGTIKVWDSLTASGTVILETTSAITAPFVLTLPVAFSVGLFITVGGTLTASVLYG